MHGNTGPADHLRPGDRLRRAGAEGCAAAPSHERGGEGEECIIEVSESLFQERSEP